MINYPEIMKKLDVSTRLRGIGIDLEENGFILKGKRIPQKKMYIVNDEEIEEETLHQKQKTQIEYLSEHAKAPIQETFKINNIMIGASVIMVTNAVLVNVPIFAIPFAYFGVVALKDNLSLIKLNKQIKNDKWFSDNEEEINRRLGCEKRLYHKLNNTSKEILTRDGKITLNNIDEFPKNDLRLVRRNISRELKKEEKQKVKILSR